MIAIKIFGCILVLSSCTLLGYCIKLKMESRYNNLENILSCIQFFENEIRYNMNDIMSISEKIGNVATGVNLNLFNKLISNHKSNPGIPLSVIWSETVEEICGKSNYDKKDIDMISKFGNILGSGDVDTQLKNLDIFQKNITSRVAECEKRNNKDCKLYSKAGIYIGTIIIILLI